MILLDVVADFLRALDEPGLYGPLFGFLVGEGFSDVHLTHGSAEFGKDFIAKRASASGTLEQWCFQVKAGDINLAAWREVQPQLFEAATSNLSHPAFNSNLPRRVALVFNGRLVGQAPIAVQDFNSGALAKLHVSPVDVWDLGTLSRGFCERTTTSLSLAKPQLLSQLGRLLQVYGEVLQGGLIAGEIERYSRSWLAAEGDELRTRAFFAASFESALLAEAFRRTNRFYEEMHCYLGAIRAGLWLAQHQGSGDGAGTAITLARSGALAAAKRDLELIADAWRSNGRNLVAAFPLAAGGPIHYLVQCARTVECAVVVAGFGSEDERTTAVNFLREWLSFEPGTMHPPSDTYAVSVVWAVLAVGDLALARTAVAKATSWLCDRYADGLGLAPLFSSALEETRILLGAPFDFIEISRRQESLLACALGDLAAFLTDEKLYSDVVNDIKAVGICPEFIQADDGVEHLRVDVASLRRYANVAFADELPTSGLYADHVEHEPTTFALADSLGCELYLALSLLLRDRYFPKLWPALARRLRGPMSDIQ